MSPASRWRSTSQSTGSALPLCWYALPSFFTSIRAPRCGCGEVVNDADEDAATGDSLKGAGTYSAALQVSTRVGTIAASQWLPGDPLEPDRRAERPHAAACPSQIDLVVGHRACGVLIVNEHRKVHDRRQAVLDPGANNNCISRNILAENAAPPALLDAELAVDPK